MSLARVEAVKNTNSATEGGKFSFEFRVQSSKYGVQTRNSELETWNPEPGTWNLELKKQLLLKYKYSK